MLCIDGVESHAGVSQGQPGVMLFRNALWLPNLVGRTAGRKIIHCWGQLEVKLLRNALNVTDTTVKHMMLMGAPGCYVHN